MGVNLNPNLHKHMDIIIINIITYIASSTSRQIHTHDILWKTCIQILEKDVRHQPKLGNPNANAKEDTHLSYGHSNTTPI